MAGFVRDVVQMAATMIPAVQQAIRQQRWKIAPNPSRPFVLSPIRRRSGWDSHSRTGKRLPMCMLRNVEVESDPLF
jgi:hypothetical protein